MLKDDLEQCIYHDVMDILCEITSDYHFDDIYLCYIKLPYLYFKDDKLVEIFDFPKFRRRKINGVLRNRFEEDDNLSQHIKNCLTGKYVFLNYNDREFIVREDVYKKLPEQRTVLLGRKSENLPVILYGGEKISLESDCVSVYLNDICDISSLSIEFDNLKKIFFSHIDRLYINVHLGHYSQESFKNIVLPQTSHLEKHIRFFFYSPHNKSGTCMELNDDMFDFSNQNGKAVCEKRFVMIHDEKNR